MDKITRRNFMRTVAIGTAVTATPLFSYAAKVLKKNTPADATNFQTPDFYFVHLTDQHVRSKRQGDKGYRKCIESIKDLKPKPDFVLMGGDLAFDGNYTPKEEYIKQLDLYKTITDELGIPYYNAVGNHDALGWSPRRKVPVDDPDMGWKLWKEKLGMDKTYYSFDHNGWHFVVLDSIHPLDTPNGPSQEAKIGEEQLKWLANDLGAADGKPVVAVTHIAAFYNITTVNGDHETKAMTNGMVLNDCKDLRLMMERHKVKALLQGHSHTTEDYCFNGVNYLTSPAASAAWWGGNWLGFEPGYTVFHCKGDQLTWERVYYKWDYVLEPEDTLEKKKNEEWDAFIKEQQELREKEISQAKISQQS